MTAVTRAAFVLFVALAGAGLWLSYADVDADHTLGCGQWWNPTLTQADVTEAGSRAASQPGGLLRDEFLAFKARKEECDRALEHRQHVVVGLGGAAVVIPAVMLFVAGGVGRDRRREA